MPSSLAAEEVPEVNLALGGGHTAAGRTRTEIASDDTDAATDVGVAGTHVVVDVQVVVAMGANIPRLADQVRAHITDRIAAHTGLTVAEVNVTIADVLPPGRL